MKHLSKVDTTRLDKIKISNTLITTDIGVLDLTSQVYPTHNLEYCNNLLYNLDNYIRNLQRRIERAELDNTDPKYLDSLDQLLQNLVRARLIFSNTEENWK